MAAARERRQREPQPQLLRLRAEPLPLSGAYEAIHDWLVPADWDGPARKQAESEIEKYLKSHGLAALQTAVSRGQYSRPSGMFFGGSRRDLVQQDFQEHYGAAPGRTTPATVVELAPGSRFLCFCFSSRLRSRIRFGRVPCAFAEMALDAPRSGRRVAFTDVTVFARDTCEEPFQPKLDRCFSADRLHRKSTLPDCCDSQRADLQARTREMPANQALEFAYYLEGPFFVDQRRVVPPSPQGCGLTHPEQQFGDSPQGRGIEKCQLHTQQSLSGDLGTPPQATGGAQGSEASPSSSRFSSGPNGR